jgi:hypothetical protein
MLSEGGAFKQRGDEMQMVQNKSRKHLIERTGRDFSLLLASLSLGFFFAQDVQAASSIRHIHATSSLSKGHSVYNLVDGQSGSLWCSQPSPMNEKIRVSFTKKVTVTEIKVRFALTPDGAVDESMVRPKFIAISDNQGTREVRLRNQSKPQFVKLSPVIRSNQIVISFPVLRAGSGEQPSLCLDDLIIRGQSGSLIGPKVSSSHQALNKSERSILGTWIDESSAPERVIDIHLDGSFTFSYTPLLDGDPISHKGKWALSRDRLVLQAKKKKYKLNARITRVDNGKAQMQQLSVIAEDKAQQYFEANYTQEPIAGQ